MRKRWKWLVAVAVAIVVLALGAPFVYIHFIEGPAPAKLALPVSHSTSTLAGSDSSGSNGARGVNGTYHVGKGSEAGYRVSEVLLGQNAIAVGRTSKMWGTVTVSNDSVTAATISVDMASVVSDQSERNAHFDGPIMDVARYPTATLKLVAPIALGTVAPEGVQSTYDVTGDLIMHGETRRVTFSLKTERTAGGIDALADIPIEFSEWGIANPSIGGFVSTASSGTLEVLVVLTTGAGNPVTSGSASTSSGGGGSGGPITVPKTTVPVITIPNG